MPTFLITYHGESGPPPSAEALAEMHAAFGAWVASVGSNMADPGAPLGPSNVVSPDGVSDSGPGGDVRGYSLINADDLAAATAAVKSHPFVARGGSLRVSQAVMP